jgi:hypothetical protein
MSKLIRNPCKTDLSEAEPHERQPNQEPGKSKQKSHQIAQSLEAPNLSPPKNQTSKKTPRKIPRPALLSSSPRARSAAWGLRDVYLCNNGGGGEGRRGRQEREGRKLEASSINGLPFCSPGRSIRLLFLSFFGNSFRRRNDPVSWFQGPWK